MRAKSPKTRTLASLKLDELARLPLYFDKAADETALDKAIVTAAARLLRAQRVLLVLQAGTAEMRVAGSKLPAGESAETLLAAVTPWLDEARNTGASSLRHGPEGAPPIEERSCLVAPLLESQGPLGCLYADIEGSQGRFEDGERGLLATLAGQAASALTNLRSTSALRQAVDLRTAEAAAASSAQRATAEVLQVIGSSAADRGPVFDKIVQSCEPLFSCMAVGLFLLDDAGMITLERMHWTQLGRTQMGEPVVAALDAGIRRVYPLPLAGSVAELVFERRDVLDFRDVLNDPDVPASLRVGATRLGMTYSTLTAPLLWKGRGIGSIGITRDISAAHDDKRGFSPDEHALLKTFADQAVIAIQNARMFKETQEALERQTATSDVLSVIGRSVSDTAPVFDMILKSCRRLFGGDQSGISLVREDGQVDYAALATDLESTEALTRGFPRPL